MKPENQKPFGLQIASKIAAHSIKEGKAPTSVILYNLFTLQKDTNFPKDLDENYFYKPNHRINDTDKKLVVKLLDDIKKPQVDIPALLEKTIAEGWVKKKSQPNKTETPARKFVAKTKKMTSKPAKTETSIVIKKNKLSIWQINNNI